MAKITAKPVALDLKLGPLNLGGGKLDLGLGRNLLAPKGAADMPDGVALVAGEYPKDLLTGGDSGGPFEEEMKEAIGDTLAKMHEIRKVAAARMKANTSSEYMLVFVFQDQDQRDAFRVAFDCERFASGGRYVNGVAFASAKGVELPPSAFRPLDFKKG